MKVAIQVWRHAHLSHTRRKFIEIQSVNILDLMDLSWSVTFCEFDDLSPCDAMCHLYTRCAYSACALAGGRPSPPVVGAAAPVPPLELTQGAQFQTFEGWTEKLWKIDRIWPETKGCWETFGSLANARHSLRVSQTLLEKLALVRLCSLAQTAKRFAAFWSAQIVTYVTYDE